MGIVNRIIVKIFKLEPEFCESCETLKEQLNISNHEKKQMLDTILSFTKPAVVEEPEARVIEPIRPKAVTWRIKQQELEKNDRLTAELNKKKQEEIAALEKELGVAEEVKDAS